MVYLSAESPIQVVTVADADERANHYTTPPQQNRLSAGVTASQVIVNKFVIYTTKSNQRQQVSY